MIRRTWFRVASFRFSRKPILHLSFDFPLDGFQISYHVGIFFKELDIKDLGGLEIRDKKGGGAA